MNNLTHFCNRCFTTWVDKSFWFSIIVQFFFSGWNNQSHLCVSPRWPFLRGWNSKTQSSKQRSKSPVTAQQSWKSANFTIGHRNIRNKAQQGKALMLYNLRTIAVLIQFFLRKQLSWQISNKAWWNLFYQLNLKSRIKCEVCQSIKQLYGWVQSQLKFF